MKRIIDGATYNTDTATLVASGRADHDPEVVETGLYQNRSGVYFAVDTITVTYRDRRGEIRERVDHEWEVVGDAAKARQYCEKYALTVDRDIDDMPPEAESSGRSEKRVRQCLCPALLGRVRGSGAGT